MSIGQGRIIKTYNGYYYVDSGTDELVTCKVKGKLKQIRFSLCTGDIVEFETNHNGESMITRILPRRNFMLRPTIANVDLIIVAFACINPDFSYLLADKLLVCSALICLVELKELPAWMVIVIISREFIISGFRLVASDNGVVIAASYWGKFKTTFQMIAVVLLIVGIPALSMVTTAVVWIALVLTVISMVDYITKNVNVLKEGKM